MGASVKQVMGVLSGWYRMYSANRFSGRVSVLVLWSIIFFTGYGVLHALMWWSPLPKLDSQHHFARVVVDSRGEPLRVFADANGVWRYKVQYDDVSPEYIQALLTYEDRWFYSHRGVNSFALVRAAGQWLVNGRLISGGSTLSMQVARIIEPHPRTLAGKVRQMFRALQLESTYSKKEILTLYLNYAPFGGPVEGVQAASFIYFGKPSNQLTHAEAALLAVLPQSPSRLRPDRHPKRAEAARNKVLRRMWAFGVWTEQQVQQAELEPVIAQRVVAPKVASLLTRRLVQTYPDQPVIHSTVDKNLQQALEAIVKDYAQSLPAQTSAAVLVLDNANAEVKAYIGSADFEDLARFGHVDMVTAKRSPGSTLKPFLYGMAIDEGLIHEQSLLLDVPSNFSGYRPENFNEDFSGPVSVRHALQRSLNVPAVQVLEALGSQTFYSRLASAGLPLQLPVEATPNLALILGGAGASLEQLTAAFSALGRGGQVRAPVFALSPSEESAEFNALDRPMLSPEAAWIVGESLRGVALNRVHRQRVIASRSPRIAFKTGTSYGYRDAWVLAASRQYTFGVWVGRPDGTPTAENVGRQNAVPLLQRVLGVFSDDQLAAPKRPSEVTQAEVCWPLGGLKSLQDSKHCLRAKTSWLAKGVAPATLREPHMAEWASYVTEVAMNEAGQRVVPSCNDRQVSVQQLAVWPQALEPWLPVKWRRAQLLPALSPACADSLRDDGQRLGFEGVTSDAEYYPLPGERRVALKPSLRGASGEVEWYLNGRWLASTSGDTPESHSLDLSDLPVGSHRLSAMDARARFKEVVFYIGR